MRTASSSSARCVKKSRPQWFLYVLECESGVLYTGIAKDVEARFAAHVRGKGAMFTRLNRPVRIVGTAPMATRSEALRAEYAFKQLSRAAKLQWLRNCAKL